MNESICNLKNLYRLITEKDYPVYSSGVISQNAKKGLTLQKFWLENLLPDFTKQGKYGTMIFRCDGTRNRYFSQFLNREPSISFYVNHALELDEIINETIIGRQCDTFVSFFKQRECDSTELLKKLEVANELFHKEDPEYDDSIKKLIDILLLSNDYYLNVGGDCLISHVSFVLTYFTIFALYGTIEGGKSRIQWLKTVAENYLSNIQESDVKALDKVKIKSNKRSILWCEKLKDEDFFGREKELFDLTESVSFGGHVLVSGIGGIGKTELLRQLLSRTVKNHLVDEIVTIQWDSNIQDSFSKAFSNIQGENSEDKLNTIFAGFRKEDNVKRLILIDNVEKEIIKDEKLEALCSLDCAIILSSRITRIKGFETYVIEPLSKEACTLVFRSAYQKKLNPSEIEIVSDLLENKFLRHTLTIGLVGRYMNRHEIDVKRMEQFEEKIKAKSLQTMYKKMYSLTGISGFEADILSLLSHIPANKYSVDFFLKYIPKLNEQKSAIKLCVENLSSYGWVIYDGENISIHPYIAECVLELDSPSELLESFFDNLEKKWKKEKDLYVDIFEISMDMYYQREEVDEILSQMVMSAVEKSKGELSLRDFTLFLLSSDYLSNIYGVGTMNGIIEKVKAVGERIDNLPHAVKVDYACAISASGDLEKILEEEKEFISTEQICNAYLFLLCNYFELGEKEKVLECANYIIENSKKSGVINNVYALLIQYYVSKAEYANAVACFEKTKDFEGDERLMRNLCMERARIHLVFREYEEAEKILVPLEEAVKKDGMGFYNKWLGLYANLLLSQNRFEEGDIYFEKHIENVGYICGVESISYIISELEYAILLGRQRKFVEAEKLYIKNREKLVAHKYNLNEYYKAGNNLSVLYLDWGKPLKALTCLDEVMEYAKEVGGVLEIEVHNNRSRALDALGRSKEAYREISEWYEPLKRVYPENFPKVLLAKERLDRLSKMFCEQK